MRWFTIAIALLAWVSGASSGWVEAQVVKVSERALPVVHEVDVVVVGGTSGGVAAAVAAAKSGAKVFLAAPRPYLGEDICASYRLWLEPGEGATTDLARKVFQPQPRKSKDAALAATEVAPGTASLPPWQPVTPMQAKRVLDQALIEAKVPFLYWSYASELLRDEQGGIAGVVIANRSGRQAVLAKVVIDATEGATAARLAGAKFSEYPAGKQTFTRVVVGGEARQAEGLRVRELPQPIDIPDMKDKPQRVIEYELALPMADGGFASKAQAEQLARDLTWTKEAVDGSECVFQAPMVSFQGKKHFTGEWSGVEGIPSDCFRPAGEERLYVLGGSADVPREVARMLVRPVHLMELGERLGKEAASLAKTVPGLKNAVIPPSAVAAPVAGELRESAGEEAARPTEAVVSEKEHGLEVLGEYDVVVVGGGTGGAPAALAAGREGAKTLLIEYLHGLGGVGTMGYISSYYFGNRVGFTKEISEGLETISKEANPSERGRWNPEHKSEWLRRELRKANVGIWYGTLGTGAVVDGNKVVGIVVHTPQGRGMVRAKFVVDSTGNADIAAAAGATCYYTDDSEIAVQGTGLPARNLGQQGLNTDYTFVDETDVVDVWRALVTAREKYKDAYDLGQLVDTRERRRIVGDFTLSPIDEWLGRTFPDTIVIARSNFDTHGFTVHPLFLLRAPDRREFVANVPWRCLLPKGLEGLMVTGLAVSAHRDAMPLIRMQADIQNQGYAVGTACAMMVQEGKGTRELDVKALQQKLVKKGILPERSLTEEDSFPLPPDRVATAVKSVINGFDQIEVVLADYDSAHPLLVEAFKGAEAPEHKLVYAQILGMMGDGTGAEVLAEAVKRSTWDRGWRYKGMGQFGAALSQLDALILALGRTRSPVAVAPIVEKAEQLDAKSEFSHFRAVALALEGLGDRSAAGALARLLGEPGLTGHAVTSISAALEEVPGSGVDETLRNKALTEIYLARALYRCGDEGGLGERILKQYAEDLHGHYARHARAVLESGPGGSTHGNR